MPKTKEKPELTPFLPKETPILFDFIFSGLKGFDFLCFFDSIYNMKTKKIALITIAVIAIFLIIYNFFLKEKKADFTLFEVVKGSVIQEVSETGQVQQGEEIKLNFKTAGAIDWIYIKVGQEVWSGSALARLDTNQLKIELNESEFAQKVAEAKFNQILAGTSLEEIKLAETALKNARQALQDTIDVSYEKGSGTLTTVNSIQKIYFTGNDQESIIIKDKKNEIENVLIETKQYIDSTKSNPTDENIDSAFLKLKSALEDVYADLTVIRNVTENVNYRNTVTLADKTSLDTAKTNISTGLANINTAQGNVKEAEDALTIKKAGPRQTDVTYYQAQVEQARAKVDLLEIQIKEVTLRSPVRARVTEINKKIGETVQPTSNDNVIVILPADPYDIKVNIYEEDIVKVKIDDPVDIKLPAFPNQIFPGKVISINPAEELIEGVVYYQVTISFENPPQEIKPGMSADVTIKTAQKDDVLIIPGAGIEKKNDKMFVRIFKNEKLEETEIQTGLNGKDDLVEIISGLAEGEQIAVPK